MAWLAALLFSVWMLLPAGLQKRRELTTPSDVGFNVGDGCPIANCSQFVTCWIGFCGELHSPANLVFNGILCGSAKEQSIQ
ncbi:MAG TPA: hypothetical protein VGM27_30205 [Acidobacteriaceae bacterium]|jgi:hypothetical protein